MNSIPLPCPFCGSSSPETELQIGTPDREGVPVNVICQHCGACGPWVYSIETKDQKIMRDDAITKWNERWTP